MKRPAIATPLCLSASTAAMAVTQVQGHLFADLAVDPGRFQAGNPDRVNRLSAPAVITAAPVRTPANTEILTVCCS